MRLGERLRTLWVAACFLTAAGPASAQDDDARTPLRTASAVRLLSPEEAVQHRPVEITGVITFIEPGRTIFFQDETGGAFSKVPRSPADLQPGQRIHVTGTTYPGLYIPGIEPKEIEVVGEAPLPPAVPVSFAQLSAGERNYERVEVRCIGRTVTSSPERTVLLVSSDSGHLEVHLPPEAASDAARLVDAALRVRGLAAGFINDRRQLVTPHVRTLGLSDITVDEPAADAATLPITPAERLLRFPARGRANHRQRVHGTVTYASPDRLFLRDGEVGLMVRGPGVGLLEPGSEKLLPIGQTMEALGFAAMGRFSAYLEDATSTPLESGAPPVPIPSDLPKVLTGAHDADLISVEAEVREIARGPEVTTLVMRSGANLFPARLETPWDEGTLTSLRHGSLLRLSGVCAVAETTTQPVGFRSKPLAFELLLRSPDDVEVVRAAPWWTARRLAGIALGALGAAALALAWAGALRRQVRRQTQVIASKAHTEAVAEERQRIAREFHDTLEQELVALALRLDTATAKLSEHPLRTLLEGCRRLVARLQSEGRDFIWDLREHTTDPAALRAALEEAVGTLCESTETICEVATEGEARTLRGAVAHSFVRIAQEACSNAIRHGHAQQVKITVSFAPDEVRLRVVDDGRGFVVTDPPSAAPGHFGLLGMRERMQKAGGRLAVESHPGQGTTVEAIVATGTPAALP